MLDETESADPPPRRDAWMRVLFVLLFALLYMVAEVVVLVIVVVQFGFVLITGARNANLLAFSANLSEYMYRILRFVMFNSDERPFPFADWPVAEHDAWEDAT